MKIVRIISYHQLLFFFIENDHQTPNIKEKQNFSLKISIFVIGIFNLIK